MVLLNFNVKLYKPLIKQEWVSKIQKKHTVTNTMYCEHTVYMIKLSYIKFC